MGADNALVALVSLWCEANGHDCAEGEEQKGREPQNTAVRTNIRVREVLQGQENECIKYYARELQALLYLKEFACLSSSSARYPV
jgi:hypothetical protein